MNPRIIKFLFSLILITLFSFRSGTLQAQELYPFQDTNGLYGFTDQFGQIVVQPKYEFANGFSEGLAHVKINGRWGYIDNNGIAVIQPTYESAQSFSGGLAPVKINGKWIFINNKGDLAIPHKYDDANAFSEGMSKVRFNNKYGFINNKGEIVVQPVYDNVFHFSEGLAAAQVNDKWGFINNKGDVVIQPEYEYVSWFSEGLAPVEINGKYGYINNKGEVVILPVYEWASRFSEGLAKVRINYKTGFINHKGDVVIQPQYGDVSPFSEGLAPVMTNGKWGYINKKGDVVIPLKYDEALSFSNGLARVKLNGASYYVDINGNTYNSRLDYATAKYNKSFPDFINSELGSYDSFLKNQGVVPLTRETLAAQVQNEVLRWQEKDEFESSADWQKRVNESTRVSKAREVADRISNDYNNNVMRLQDEYKEKYDRLAKDYCDYKAASFAQQELTLKPYDADNQTFLISSSTAGDILLPVPVSQAKDFKTNWSSIKSSVKAEFVPTGHDVAIKSVRFGDYVYDSNTRADYALTDVEYNFRPLDLSNMNYNFAPIATTAAASTGVSVGSEKAITPQTITPERRRVQGGTLSDVDTNIPEGTRKSDNIFAVVIANSNYAQASTVVNAENDGTAFAQYLTKTLGVPESQLKVYHDATYGTMASAMAYLQDVSQAYRDEPFNVIFYYVGHGLPDDDSKEAYLLPVDIDPRITRACYPLKQLYKELSELNADNVTVFIDACFSGSNHGDGMLLADARGVAIKTKDLTPGGKMVVMSASQAGQTAYPYKEKGHGLFTYCILKKLQESRGEVTLGELSDYVTDQVSKISIKVNSKPQNPTVATSPSMAGIWRTIPFGGK